jgi:hypothetical protein
VTSSPVSGSVVVEVLVLVVAATVVLGVVLGVVLVVVRDVVLAVREEVGPEVTVVEMLGLIVGLFETTAAGSMPVRAASGGESQRAAPVAMSTSPLAAAATRTPITCRLPATLYPAAFHYPTVLY